MTPPVDPLYFVGGLSVFTCAIFGSLLGSMRTEGGKIRAKTFELPELLICIVLAGLFGGLVVMSAFGSTSAAAPKITLDQVIPSSLSFVVIPVGITAFLAFRGIDVRVAMGLNRIPILRALAIGFGLVLAALPLVLSVSLITQMILRQDAQEQELVTLFRQAAQQANRDGLTKILFAGTVIAPIWEEFFFRGFFYVVFKRYIGTAGSALLTSVLFAAFHGSLTAFPGLFVLALCFTIAFEATGSLVVPMTMHALFNASQLGVLYFISRAPVAG